MVLYIKTSNAPYVLKDIKIIQSKYPVLVFEFKQNNNLLNFIFYCLYLIIFFIKNVKKIKVVLATFIDYYSPLVILLAMVFRKKTCFTLGGYECVSIPEFNYGAFSSKSKSFFVKLVLKNANFLLPVHESLIYNKNFYFDSKGRDNGFIYHIKNTKAQIITIYNAYDNIMIGNLKKEKNLVVCTAVCNTPSTFYVKGLDTLITASKSLLDYNFTIIGIDKKLHSWIIKRYFYCDNVKILPKITQDEVFEYYKKASIYIQPSISEGMPNALCEAMLFNCFPMGSDITSIPFIIGDTGLILKKKSPEVIINSLISAQIPNNYDNPRKRIMSLFPLEKRKEKYYQIIETCVK